MRIRWGLVPSALVAAGTAAAIAVAPIAPAAPAEHNVSSGLIGHAQKSSYVNELVSYNRGYALDHYGFGHFGHGKFKFKPGKFKHGKFKFKPGKFKPGRGYRY